jgi:hypothetical protein
MKLKDISIILIIFGLAVISNSFLDFYTLLFPIVIKSAEWVFEVSQRIAEIILFPLFGILTVLLGLNFSKFKRNKIIVNTTKILCGSLCILFFSFLSLNIILYGISMKSVQNNKIEALKTERDNTKEKINAIYIENREYIPVKQYSSTIQQLNNDLVDKINYLNLMHTKINIKTLITLFLFSFVYLAAGIKLFSLDDLWRKRHGFVK